MSRKWLVSFPIGQEDISRKEGENLRDFARRLVSNKKFDEALSVYLELLRHSPLDVGLLTNLSLVESKLESKIDRWQQSARFAELATRLDPNNVKAWYRFGFALAEMGLKDRADECCSRALALDPSNAAVVELRTSLKSVPALIATHEIFGALLNSDSPASSVPEIVWGRVFGFCGVSDRAALRLTCSLFHHVVWRHLASTSVRVHAAVPWRLAHRMRHLKELAVVLRHGKIETDWTSVCESLFGGKPISAVFPQLARLSISPSVSGLSRKEIMALIAKLERDTFDDENDLENFMACPDTGRLDLAASLGRASPKMEVRLCNLRPPKAVPGNLHSLRVEGNLAHCTSDDFKGLARSNLFVLRVADTRDGVVGWSSGSPIENAFCKFLPATLERLTLKHLPSFVFPCDGWPQGLKRLSVAGLYWKDPHLRGLPPLLEVFKIDLSVQETEDRVRQFAFETFSLVGLPKRVQQCVVRR